MGANEAANHCRPYRCCGSCEYDCCGVLILPISLSITYIECMFMYASVCLATQNSDIYIIYTSAYMYN